MKTAAFSFAIVLTLAGTYDTARAEINCNQVRRYAETGRSAEDIAETMIIPLEEVQKCLNAEKPAPTPQAKKQ